MLFGVKASTTSRIAHTQTATNILVSQVVISQESVVISQESGNVTRETPS